MLSRLLVDATALVTLDLSGNPPSHLAHCTCTYIPLAFRALFSPKRARLPPRCTVRDGAGNRIAHLPQSISELSGLEVLRLHNNALARLDELAFLRPLRLLARLTLMHNPLMMQRLSTLQRLALQQDQPLYSEGSHQMEHNPLAYRFKVLARLQQLRQLDSMPVTKLERIRALAVMGPRHPRPDDEA